MRCARYGAVPLFTMVAVFTLALGIGANTAIFSIVNGVILRPLNYPEPDRLMFLRTQSAALSGARDRIDPGHVSPPEYLEFREMNQSFAAVGAFAIGEVNLTAGDQPRRVRSASVDEHLLNALALQPVHGRLFSEEETHPGGPLPAPLAILSHELWQAGLGGRPIVGEVVELDGRPHEVLGIMSPGADLTDNRVEVWLPLGLDPANRQNRGAHYLHVIGRLKDGVTEQSARAELETLIEQWSKRVGIGPGVGAAGHVFMPGGHVLRMKPLQEQVLGNAGRAIWVLQAAVGLVLLIVCANLASLLLARAEMRRHELVVRKALGASDARLLRQFITEGVLLSAVGGALGLWFARGGLQALIRAYPASLPRTSEVTLDWVVWVLTAAAAVATGVLFGLAPMMHVRVDRLLTALQADGGKGATPSVRQYIRHGLVIAEVALAVVLVAGAALLVRTVYNLTQVDAGFDGSRLMTFSVTLPQVDYQFPSNRALLYGRLLDKLRAVPGIDAGTAVSGLPPNFPAVAANTDIDTYSAPPQGPIEIVDYYQYVMSDYFDTMGIPIVAGRGFEPTDAATPGLVAVVNETFVRTFLSSQNPIGRRLRRCARCNDGDPWFTIIGVAKDVKQRGLDRDTGTEVYVFVEQANIRRAINLAPGTLNVVLRTALPVAAMSATITGSVGEIDPRVPVVRLREMDAVVAESITRPRLLAVLVGTFAALALLLAAVGTYGVLSYVVAQRRREIGIRMALGAARSSVLAMMMKQGLVLAGTGVIVGLAGSLGLNQLLTSLLFGVQPADVMTLATVIPLIVGVAALATWVPAWRASRLDPNVVLRAE
jgi:putative ABC transport system permease protein